MRQSYSITFGGLDSLVIKEIPDQAEPGKPVISGQGLWINHAEMHSPRRMGQKQHQSASN